MLTNKKQLIIIFIICSLIISGIAVYYLSMNINKYIILNQKSAILKDYSVIYYDFDKDGISEKYFLHNYEKTSTSAIQFYENGQIKKQFNFKNHLELRTVTFDDYNGDLKDEMILFTKNGDSLYVSILDLTFSSYILHEELIFVRNHVNDYKPWDYSLRSAKFIKTKDNRKKLIFSLNSGFAFYPRGIYLYDIEQKRIVKRFENEASKTHLNLIDFDDDGFDEIIVSGVAPDNGNPLSKYSDNFSWLFVLDSELNLFWEPKKMTSHPSSYHATPFEYNNNRYILSATNATKNIDDWAGIRVYDKDGKIINELKTMLGEINAKIGLLHKGNSVFFIVTTQNGVAKIYDFNLKLLTEKKLSKSRIILYDIIDIENNGNSEYLFINGKSFIITDENFVILGKYNYNSFVNRNYLSCFSYKKNKYANLQIGYRSENFYNLLSFHKSEIYAWIPFLFPMFAVIIFVFLYLIHRIGQQISRHYSIHNYFINRADSALLLYSSEGKVKAVNNLFLSIFGIKKSIIKNARLEIILIDNQNLLKIISNKIKSEKGVHQEFRTKTNRIGEILITPIKSFWGFVYAYLLEFKDITNPIISERQKLWSKTSQKIAHDIKTPLSTIQLNLATLSKRIDEENISQKDGFKDDISMIRSELNRIRNLTKGFLQFTNLEKPKLQIVNIKEIIEKSLQQFNSYTENGVKIATSYSAEIKPIYVDPIQIEQLFHIIIENSIDGMNGKGSIEIKIFLAQKMSLEEYLQIEITDNGKGIEQEKIDEIFEPYYTTKRDGTGLGLAIAKKIIEDNNSKITIYSKIGLGTTVTLNLPIEN